MTGLDREPAPCHKKAVTRRAPTGRRRLPDHRKAIVDRIALLYGGARALAANPSANLQEAHRG